jgi:hypothetical protein
MPSHSEFSVAQGIARFLADFRESQSLDAEPELAEPSMCVENCGMPAAYLQRCFACNAKGRVTS